MTAPTLYLDFDGVLHPADVRVTKAEPLRPRVYVRGRATDEPLFRYTALLELLLSPHPELRIVLATSWVPALGYDFAVNQLSPALQERIIGATTLPAPTRFESIERDAANRGLTRWLALDDDLFGWPEEWRHLVVAPTNPELALAQPGVAAELSQMLNALCAGRPLELETKVAAVRPTMERLWAIPGLTKDEISVALEEDATVGAILHQARARPPAPIATADSAAANEEVMAGIRHVSENAVLARIETKELIAGAELGARLGVSEQALRTAVESGQLFAIEGPVDELYYPAFFADDRYPKGVLGEVSQSLGRLPGPSKYHFLTSKSTLLGQTPLEALAGGRLAAVLVSAKGFRER